MHYVKRPIEAMLVAEETMADVADHFDGRVVETTEGDVVEVRVGPGGYVEAPAGVYLIREGGTFRTEPQEQFEAIWQPVEETA